MIGITKGVHYLHSKEVIHGDLKSVGFNVNPTFCRSFLIDILIKKANVLLSPNHTPLLTDFGISQLLIANATQDNPTNMPGTVRWMAPELIDASQIYESQESKKKVDIWALGMVYLVSFILFRKTDRTLLTRISRKY